MNNTYIVYNIAISTIDYKSDILYSYTMPPEFEGKVCIGSHVVVPFGKNNYKRIGIVIDRYCTEDVEGIKNIHAVLDDVPRVSFEMIQIIKLIKSTCFCTYYDVAKLILPKKLSKKVKSLIYTIKCSNQDVLDEAEKTFLNRVLSLNKKFFCIEDLKNLNVKNSRRLMNDLVAKGVIEELLPNIHKEKIPPFLKLSSEVIYSECSITDKQRKICEFLKLNGVVTPKEIIEKLNISNSVINNLVKKGILVRTDLSANIIYDNENFKDHILNESQKEIFDKILNVYKKNKYSVSLIHGVTGSGKTSIILKLIDEVLRENKSIIFLVPEIALTVQFIKTFTSKYKSKVAVFHSKLSASERNKVLEDARNGKINIVLGARNAIFTPFENLGLIVIDEEHEFTYKSEFSPRFDARIIANYRAKFNKCMLILSSATPSIESYYMAKMGKYDLYTLNSRYGNAVLPESQIVDISGRFNREGQIIFSNELINAISENIKQEKQTMLLINRRGFHTFVKCMNCGEVQACPHCSVSLTYHKTRSELVCHYCGYTNHDTKTCMNCKEESLIYFGFGTQKAEYQLKALLPDAKILRIDSDTKTQSQEGTIKNFENGEYDVLIGTQMISKGFNFPNVTLVGILLADQYLYSSDFRASEKTFSLITQTIGRAGRGNFKGKAIIQTFSPESDILNLAANQDYVTFFEREILMRKLMLNPPFSDICLVLFREKNRALVEESACNFFKILKDLAKEKYSNIPLRIFPPRSCAVEKVAENYRYEIILKCRNNKAFRSLIQEVLLKIKSISRYKKVYIGVDINPTSIL